MLRTILYFEANYIKVFWHISPCAEFSLLSVHVPWRLCFCFLYRPLKDMLHRGDRAMIYVFIAASYFPWLTIQPFPLAGWTAELWWIVWVLASLGILYQQLFHERYKCLETFFYLFMGIVPSVAIINMVCTQNICYCW